MPHNTSLWRALRASGPTCHKGDMSNDASIAHPTFCRQLLADELSRRCARNPRYSLRAFATSLGVDPGNLSRALRGQSNLSPAYARRIAEALALPPGVAADLVASAADARQSATGRTTKARQAATVANFTNIETSMFDVIADPLHYAILELATATETFKADTAWVARALGVTSIRVNEAVQRLVDVGLLDVTREGRNQRWKKLTPRIKTRGGKTTSAALRRHQRLILQQGADAVDEVPIPSSAAMCPLRCLSTSI